MKMVLIERRSRKILSRRNFTTVDVNYSFPKKAGFSIPQGKRMNPIYW